MIQKTLFALLLLASTLLSPAPALAQTTDCGGGLPLGVPLGDLEEVPRGPDAFRCYVIGLYRYIIGLAVILAAIVSTWGGYVWLTSGGDPAKITHARELIVGALSGLALLLLAATVLRLIGIGSS